MVELPPVVHNKALAAGATHWLSELDDLVGSLESEWGISVGRPYEDATEAFVARAVCDDGTTAVLKLIIPRTGDAARHEITVLRLSDGDGCVRLIRHDVDRAALLLERLGSPLSDLGLPVGQRHEILCAAAARVWRPGAGYGLPSGAEKGQWLADHIEATWEETGRPCSEKAVEDALACAARRIAAHDDERAVLVHGDVHQWNALQAGDGYRLVDPDGLFAEAEYDLGVIMREDPLDLILGDPHERAFRLAARTGLDATAIWQWGVVERVSTGLLCTKIGLQPVGREMLAAADHLAGGRLEI